MMRRMIGRYKGQRAMAVAVEAAVVEAQGARLGTDWLDALAD